MPRVTPIEMYKQTGRPTLSLRKTLALAELLTRVVMPLKDKADGDRV